MTGGGVGDALIVRYSFHRALGVNLIAFPLLAWLWWIGALSQPFFLPVTIIAGIAALYSLAMAMLALDRRPALIVGEAGVDLPCLGDTHIAYADLDSFWFAQQAQGDAATRTRWWTLSLQCRPRRYFDRPLWAALRDIRTNTLLEGDVRFDCRYLSVPMVEIAQHLKRRHPGGWIDSHRASELDTILPRGS